jgi:hypothetical protein
MPPCSKRNASRGEKIRELSTTKPGTIAARWELSTTTKKRTKHRKKPLRNSGRRVTTGHPLGMTIDDASVRAYSAVLAWKKRACLATEVGPTSPKTLILKKYESGAHAQLSKGVRQYCEPLAQSMPRLASTELGQGDAVCHPVQSQIPPSAAGTCRSLANGRGLRLAR